MRKVLGVVAAIVVVGGSVIGCEPPQASTPPASAGAAAPGASTTANKPGAGGTGAQAVGAPGPSVNEGYHDTTGSKAK